ncbi:hypothetical protein FRC06_008391, partial [Ceratobasidium sp. 370]
MTSISSLTFSGLNTEIANVLSTQLADRGAVPNQLKGLRLFHTLPDQTLHWATIFRGLTDLQLVGLWDDCSPTQDQLMQMISGSPRLHTLRIRGVRVSGVVGGKYPAISLPGLRLLDIQRMNPTLVLLLISSLSPGPLPLDFRLEKLSGSLFIEEITTFLGRSNVASLGLEYTSGATAPLLPPIEWVPHLSHMGIFILRRGLFESANLKGMLTFTDGTPAPR